MSQRIFTGRGDILAGYWADVLSAETKRREEAEGRCAALSQLGAVSVISLTTQRDRYAETLREIANNAHTWERDALANIARAALNEGEKP